MNSVYSKPKSKNGANGNVLALGFFVKYFIILIIIAKIAQYKKEIKNKIINNQLLSYREFKFLL